MWVRKGARVVPLAVMAKVAKQVAAIKIQGMGGCEESAAVLLFVILRPWTGKTVWWN
jgi:hypothetical protein